MRKLLQDEVSMLLSSSYGERRERKESSLMNPTQWYWGKIFDRRCNWKSALYPQSVVVVAVISRSPGIPAISNAKEKNRIAHVQQQNWWEIMQNRHINLVLCTSFTGVPPQGFHRRCHRQEDEAVSLSLCHVPCLHGRGIKMIFPNQKIEVYTAAWPST